MKRSLPICLFLMFRRAVCFTLRRQPKLHTSTSRLLASTEARLAIHSSKSITSVDKKRDAAKLLNLSSVTKEDLTAIITSWGYPKFRANQIWQWIRVNGVTDVEQMTNLPKDLRAQLDEFSRPSILKIELEQISKDGTVKRAYRCQDGQLIESVLMPYEDGRYTACISSQAGCAQGCVFCATGQMGFARQLTSDEIFEQVARFAAELKQRDETQEEIKNKSHGKEMRLSNIVFMGMGEPLANYRQVKTAIQRINKELGIGARRITISTVGIVPNIRKLYEDPDMPPVRLAVSLHCATDEERSALLPANRRYGGLEELMGAIKDYQEKSGSRVTLEWALIEGTNDSVEVARTLGRLVSQHDLRRDMVHVNVIPLNPTGGYGGSPSGRKRVNLFGQTLEGEYGIKATPRVRRGIDIDAGCGQLKSKVEREVQRSLEESMHFVPTQGDVANKDKHTARFVIGDDAVDFDEAEFVDPVFTTEEEKDEAERIINLVKGSTINSPTQQ